MQNGWPSAEAMENFVTAQKRPAWSVQLYFYGPEETVRATWQAAKRRIGKAIAGATFQDGEFLTLPIPKEKEPTQSDKPRLGIPALEVFNMVARNPRQRKRPLGRTRRPFCHDPAQGLGPVGIGARPI